MRVVKRPGFEDIEPMKRLHMVARTHQEVAELTGLTKSGVRWIEHQALCKLFGGLVSDAEFIRLARTLCQ